MLHHYKLLLLLMQLLQLVQYVPQEATPIVTAILSAIVTATYCYPTTSVPLVMFKPALIFTSYSHLFIPLLIC